MGNTSSYQLFFLHRFPMNASPLPVGKEPVAWKEDCAEYWIKELQESMDRCTGRRDMTEILLKTALNSIQSISTATERWNG